MVVKLDPNAYAETDSSPLGLEGTQYGVSVHMVVEYLEDAHSMPRTVALAVADHLWNVWNDVAEGDDVKQGDLIDGVIQGWIR